MYDGSERAGLTTVSQFVPRLFLNIYLLHGNAFQKVSIKKTCNLFGKIIIKAQMPVSAIFSPIIQ